MRFSKGNDALGTKNRGDVCESSLCTLCRADCVGKCETWLSSMVGRELLYPRSFGLVTAGANNTSHVGVSYNSLRVQGYAYGANGMTNELTNSPDDCVFPNVSLETEFGKKQKTKIKMPLMTGALGSTFIAEKYWDSFAIGGALVGIPVVIGENVVGVDRNSEISNTETKQGKIKSAPELDRRIDTYLRYYDGYGAIIVQLNVEDTRNGVAEYVVDKYGDKCIIELKWGQGAKNIGGEIQVRSLEYATFLKNRGYVVDPDPTKEDVRQGFEQGAIKAFARHSRLGGTNLSSVGQVQEDFMSSVAYLRSIGFERITLKTGSYGMEELAMAIKFATDAELDLLTIDGSGGGTGMSPWNMMQSWGVPSIILHAKAHEYASLLSAKGKSVVDMSFAGGFALEDHIFKALAVGAPYTKLVCMGRAIMIPGFLGANIEGAIYPERRAEVNGNWNELPKNVLEVGKTADEIFACYHDLEDKLGKDEMKNIPYGAIAFYTLADKLGCGLQQLMAGARKFSLNKITRQEIFSGNRETAKETGIPHVADVNDESARKILNS
ncbi:FMN-binding glutamate synthase family protein [Desulfobacter hydrogenophilus]|uniref:FMN-binding glutamate synthase family protein n=1 Tax=Desulfobacter hydrogenophilus TaxID=2291 RepID=A0A328FHC5_9BACT|nr:glutamate synthase-related protein [Desulfobacter hydrogenophilus]NDY70842.1 FMN-binding glutamate synthase family protein [Desulfobacter hydrogenophilus]QBH11613.1 FMN-binding glutamate synthase family protein [Desulfobacter hydrogenophilus]RAM03220.1 FMN-binding glutamate synthase family protein [Desulfobacter hydrogenophilus]